MMHYNIFGLNRTATTAVEFAFLAPVFLLLVLGMTAYGILLGATHSVQQIAADAARLAVAGANAAERTAIVADFAGRNTGNYAFIDPDRLDLAIADHPVEPGRLIVSARYDAAHLPIWGMVSMLPLPGKLIERNSTIRAGGL
ncbi:MAG: pilus assembly protein [Rhizobiaceae bacterium]|nr:pilus assembly protein [Rhizobiaceae bacterium]MCV0405561.1 pilus assembly protein [Rhizobiaceae bacterium]